jgi:hypothetical protein
MSKKKKREDQYFPIPQGLVLRKSTQLEDNLDLTRQIVSKLFRQLIVRQCLALQAPGTLILVRSRSR